MLTSKWMHVESFTSKHVGQPNLKLCWCNGFSHMTSTEFNTALEQVGGLPSNTPACPMRLPCKYTRDLLQSRSSWAWFTPVLPHPKMPLSLFCSIIPLPLHWPMHSLCSPVAHLLEAVLGGVTIFYGHQKIWKKMLGMGCPPSLQQRTSPELFFPSHCMLKSSLHVTFIGPVCPRVFKPFENEPKCGGVMEKEEIYWKGSQGKLITFVRASYICQLHLFATLYECRVGRRASGNFGEDFN